MVDVLVCHPSEILRKVCEPIDEIDREALDIGRRLVEGMVAHNGIGLAAPQIGILKRAVVVGVPTESGLKPIVMFNPEIIGRSEEVTPLDEGCLSLPGRRFRVLRPAEVRVRYIMQDGILTEASASGIVAKCIQHEVDHLDGRLVIDIGTEVADQSRP